MRLISTTNRRQLREIKIHRLCFLVESRWDLCFLAERRRWSGLPIWMNMKSLLYGWLHLGLSLYWWFSFFLYIENSSFQISQILLLPVFCYFILIFFCFSVMLIISVFFVRLSLAICGLVLDFDSYLDIFLKYYTKWEVRLNMTDSFLISDRFLS